MSEPRRPAAFRIEPEPKLEPKPVREPEARRHAEPARRPRAVSKSDVAIVTPDAIDVFDGGDIETAEPPPAVAPRRRSRLGAIFFGALGILVSLAVGLWTDALIRDLFSRADWLGWLATGVAAIAALSLVVILARELFAHRHFKRRQRILPIKINEVHQRLARLGTSQQFCCGRQRRFGGQ